MPRFSLSLRLTLLFAAIATAVLLALGLLIGQAVERHFVEQDMELMHGKLHLIGHILEKIRTPTELDDLPRRLDDPLVGHHGLAVLVQDPGGRKLFATPDTDFPSALLSRDRSDMPPLTWRQQTANGALPRRGTVTLLPTGIEAIPQVRVAVAVDITHHEHFMAAFRQTLWRFVSAAALLAGIFGWLAVRHGLAPLAAIRHGAERVTARHLDTRLATQTFPVELAELADTLNRMFARLEEAFQRLSDFSSDIAHELRTPVNTLLTQTQVALSRARNAEEYREVLVSNAEEYERLARMIADMLFLAQADHGLIVLHRESVDLAAEVRALFDFFDALAEEKNLRLTLDGEGRIAGDRLMLRRALGNLLSNAIRHADPGGEIRVRIDTRAEDVALAVANTGTAIPPEHLPYLFDRFYRTDPARHGEGAGLGLAIARSIVRAHGGDLLALPKTEGACFEMRLSEPAT